ncbi:MAG: fasciclin domain-containing protein [Thermoleophilia bacterium]|nr:fasciclin domain-containing protein [Thermoleophilia bacterium]
MKIRTRIAPAAAVMAAAAVAAAPAVASHHSTTPAKPKQNIVQVASSNPQFSTLVSLIKEAGLVKALSAKGPYTVFAPTNAAFKKVPAATLAQLKANPDQLKAVLTYHVLPKQVLAAQVVKLNAARTLEGSGIKIRTRKGVVRINNNAVVTKTNVMASNGVIHVINNVLIPPAK